MKLPNKKLKYANVINKDKISVFIIYKEDIKYITSYVYTYIRFYLFSFRERRRDGERRGEKHQCVIASCVRTWPATLTCAQTGS